MVLLSLSFFIGRFWSWLPIQFIGGFWLVLFGYSLLVLPFDQSCCLFIEKEMDFSNRTSRTIFSLLLSLSMVRTMLGVPVVTTYEVAIDKQATEKELKIVVVSDLHLGENCR